MHLRNLTQDQSDEYLRQIPAADGLQVLFISYLERHKDDASYISNRYPIGELKQFAATGVLFNNGEEHRHNFQGYGQGYGHVMFLGIQSLVRPVSLGKGITGSGYDDLPLRPGIDEARRQGGTIIWCHNTNGHEDVPNALAGKLDALNVFDGSRTGKFEDNYYRYLNIGLRVPISTGTDWFMYDFSRVYAKVKGPLSLQGWLDAVKAGRPSPPTATANHALRDARSATPQPGETRDECIEGAGIGRHDFATPTRTQWQGRLHPAGPENGSHYEARLAREVRLDTPVG